MYLHDVVVVFSHPMLHKRHGVSISKGDLFWDKAHPELDGDTFDQLD